MSDPIEVVLVDIGNTQIKSAEAVLSQILQEVQWDSFEALDAHYPAEIPFCICSKGPHVKSVKKRNLLFVSNDTPAGLKLDYQTLHTLGADRIAAAIGCHALFPQKNCLLVDLGTCVTMDLISAEGVFHGGVIAPGLKMRLKAMAEGTASLPDLSADWTYDQNIVTGKSTHQCLALGAHRGIVHEIAGFKAALSSKFTSINVILTGGDAHHFESIVKAHIFAGSKIVMTGLYRIWNNQ